MDRWVVCVMSLTVLRAFVAVGPAPAQEVAREVGFGVGALTVTDFETVRLASGNADGSVFLRLHVRDRLFVEPEAGFTVVSDGEATLVILNPSLHLGYQFGDGGDAAWFAAGHVAAQAVGVFDVNDDRRGDVGAGGSAGYRIPVLEDHASVRLEGRFRHWFDSGTSSVSGIAKVALRW